MKQDYWTDERLAELDAKKLLNVRTNGAAMGADELVVRCDALLKLKKVRGAGIMRGGKPEGEKSLQAEGDEKLTILAQDLLSKYDLSEETSRAASIGVKGYRYRSLVGKKGNSKLGGHQLKGEVAIDRYISFQLGDEKMALGLLLAKGQPPEQHRWIVSGPKRLLPEQRPVVELVPGMSDLSSNINEGIAYEDFEAAAISFEALVDALAVKK